MRKVDEGYFRFFELKIRFEKNQKREREREKNPRMFSRKIILYFILFT